LNSIGTKIPHFPKLTHKKNNPSKSLIKSTYIGTIPIAHVKFVRFSRISEPNIDQYQTHSLYSIVRQMAPLSGSQEQGDLTISAQPQIVQKTDMNMKAGSLERVKQQTSKRGLRFWLIFPGLCFAILLAALDTAIIATVLPTISAELDSGSLFIWAINGYFVGIAAVQPMYGQFSDIFGRRWPMLISVAIFALGSGLCGGSNSTAMLIAARVVQGLGAGGIFSLVEIIVADLVPLRERQQL
jgi:hypothetical protein